MDLCVLILAEAPPQSPRPISEEQNFLQRAGKVIAAIMAF